MPKVLVIEKTRTIHELLKGCFADNISVDVLSLSAIATTEFTSRGYDVLIWDAVTSKTEQSKGLALLDQLTKQSIKTFIIVVTDQQGGTLPLDRLRAHAHRTLTRPVDTDEICAKRG
jgi:DNA-binding response OmpR family regulator